jgi:hypothetical protein
MPPFSGSGSPRRTDIFLGIFDGEENETTGATPSLTDTLNFSYTPLTDTWSFNNSAVRTLNP